MYQKKSESNINRYFSFFAINKLAIIMQRHYNLSNFQIITFTWLKGLWTGILISLVLHNLYSH